MRKSILILCASLTTTVAVVALGWVRSSAPLDAQSPTTQSNAKPLAPKVVLEEKTRDLGTLDPTDKCRHLFIVRNAGNAPLKLAKTGTSCKCTVSVIPSEDIPPGMGGPIEIESKTDGVEGPFSHVASFATNDPTTPRIELTIQGDVRRYAAAEPSCVHQAELKSGEAFIASTLIFSEVWDHFTLENVHSTVEGLRWEFQPASQEDLQSRGARSGYLATLHVPGDWSGTELNGWLEAEAKPHGDMQPNGSDKSRKVSVAISARRIALRTVYGPLIDHQGIVHLGAIDSEKGAKAQLLLKLRGEHREIRVREIQTKPDFLIAKMFADSPELAKKGLYRIVVEVPPGAPIGSHAAPETMGTLLVRTDHPELPETVSLRVSFAVLDGSGT